MSEADYENAEDTPSSRKRPQPDLVHALTERRRGGSHKKCTRCHEIKHVVHFPKHALTKDGVNTHCRDCLRTLSAEGRTKPNGRPKETPIHLLCREDLMLLILVKDRLFTNYMQADDYYKAKAYLYGLLRDLDRAFEGAWKEFRQTQREEIETFDESISEVQLLGN